jgi:hypothetical protein
MEHAVADSLGDDSLAIVVDLHISNRPPSE